jgi:hypothetical protein
MKEFCAQEIIAFNLHCTTVAMPLAKINNSGSP